MAFIKSISSSVFRTSLRIHLTQAKQIHRFVAPTLKEYKRRSIILNQNGSQPKPHRNTFLDWNLNAELYAFGKRLNEEFDRELLQQAFTQRSYIIQEEERQKEVGIENPEIQLKDSRELAREGETFMRDYIHLYIEAAFPRFPAPGIDAITEYLTSENHLAHISKHLGTHDLILTVEHPVSEPVMADTFKAVVGALIQSSGNERAAHFVRDFVITMLNGKDVNELWPIEDPITMLSDILKKSGKEMEPRIIGETGKNTVIPCYKVGLYIDKELFAEGYGETVEVAHDAAARVGLQEIFGTTDDMRPIDFKIPGIPDKVHSDRLLENSQSS